MQTFVRTSGSIDGITWISFIFLFTFSVAASGAPERRVVHDSDTASIWVQDSLHNVPRTAKLEDVPDGNEVDRVKVAEAAKGERESWQLVVTPRGDKNLEVGELRFSDLQNVNNDATISGERVSVRLMGYVQRDKEDAKSHPDVLFNEGKFTKARAGENYTLWCTVHVPREIPGGRYRGKVTVPAGNREYRVPIQVRVWDFALPKQTSVQTQLFSIGRGSLRSFFPEEEYDLGTLRRQMFDLFVERRFSPSKPTPKPLRSGSRPLPRIVDADEEKRGQALKLQTLGLNFPRTKKSNTDHVTVSAWIKPRYRYTTYFPILSKRWSHTNNDPKSGFSLKMQVHEVEKYRNKKGHFIDWIVHTEDGDRVKTRLRKAPTMEEWSHVAATWDGEHATIYLNGEEVARSEGGGAIASNDLPIALGTWSDRPYISTHRGQHGFNGLVDNARVYPKALSPDQIRADMEADEAVTNATIDRNFSDFSTSIDDLQAYLPARHLLSDKTQEYYLKWCRWWTEKGLHAGKVPWRMTPDTGEKRRVTKAFFDTYVDALRERGWLDRVWARLPGDESTGAEAVENRKTGYFWHRLAPDLRRHWTFNGLHWGDPSEERKMATLQDADYATDIFSVNPVQYLGYPRLRRFLGDRSEREVSWYLHHRIHINQEPLRTRLNFWQMWQRDVRMVTLWNTTLWDTGDQRGSVEKRPRGFIYKSRWFGNGVLFWPGEEEVVPSRRADLLRDGIEDYGYFRLLQQLHEKVEDRMFDHPDPRFAVQYALDIPGNIVDVLRHRTEDPELVKEHRRHVARLIQKLQDKIQEQ